LLSHHFLSLCQSSVCSLAPQQHFGVRESSLGFPSL
jgi:hypothetical protein